MMNLHAETQRLESHIFFIILFRNFAGDGSDHDFSDDDDGSGNR